MQPVPILPVKVISLERSVERRAEFARRNVEPALRPSFSEMEEMISALKGTMA